MKFILHLAALMLIFTGCVRFEDNYSGIPATNSKNEAKAPKIQNITFKNLDSAIVSMADQLFTSNVKNKPTNIILTSFVELNQLKKTTTFGRLLSESMFNELHVRHFNITDFRGQDAVSVNKEGEFHITRDVEKLKDHIEATEYVLVGTYVKFEHESVLINARIIDSETGNLISTARVVYRPSDCKIFNLCQDDQFDRPVDGIDIVTDK